VHFRTSVGDMILARMEGTPPASGGQVPPGFGERLTPEDLEIHLSQDRVAGQAFQRTHPGLLDELAAQPCPTAGADARRQGSPAAQKRTRCSSTL
jgi:hypothetical protein